MRTIADVLRSCARLSGLLVALLGLAPIANAQSTEPPLADRGKPCLTHSLRNSRTDKGMHEFALPQD